MAGGKVEPHRAGALVLLHEFAGHGVDRRDVVHVEGVTQAEGIGEYRRTKEYGMAMKGGNGPDPCHRVQRDQECIGADYFLFHSRLSFTVRSWSFADRPALHRTSFTRDMSLPTPAHHVLFVA